MIGIVMPTHKGVLDGDPRAGFGWHTKKWGDLDGRWGMGGALSCSAMSEGWEGRLQTRSSDD